MKESYQSGPLLEKKDESIKNTLGKVGVGIAATVASLAMPNDVVAQKGLVGRFMDKIHPKTEQANENKAEKNNSTFNKDESNNYSKGELVGENNNIKQFEVKNIKELRDLLKNYDQVLSSSLYDDELASIMKDILEQNLLIMTTEVESVKTLNIAREILSERLDVFESTTFFDKLKYKNDHLFYKELDGNIRNSLLLRLYKKEVSRETRDNALSIPWEGDKIGFKYPFDKEYKSDENFYRAVSYAKSKDYKTARSMALSNAENKITTNEMKLTGYFEFESGSINLIDEQTFKDSNGFFAVVVAVEISKKDTKVITSKPEMGKREEKKETPPKIIENKSKIEYSNSKTKESKIEKPTPPPIGNKPEKQPEYKKEEGSAYRVTPSDIKESMGKDFDSYKKAQQEEFDAFKKANQAEFDKFKNDRENK